jgi:ComF family protein
MWQFLRERLVDSLTDLIFPLTCFVCSAPIDSQPDSHAVCPACRTLVLDDPLESCPRCAGTVGPFSVTENGCAKCGDNAFKFDRAFRLGPYDGLLKDVILRMKVAAGEPLAETVGFRECRCDAVVPVPLHWRKRISRGYNPASALARAIAAELRVPYLDALKRTRNTPSQTGLSATERRTNVKGAFSVSRRGLAQSLRVILVDDVMTTGSTCSAAAHALKADGAAQVIAAVLAHR